jgi:hypothetical protein
VATTRNDEVKYLAQKGPITPARPGSRRLALTIAHTCATASFDTEEFGNELEAQYAGLLATLYRSTCVPMKPFLSESLELLCSASFELFGSPVPAFQAWGSA